MAAVDPDILKRAKAGDRVALGALIEPELDRVYATCRRMESNRDDAAELAQDAIVRAIRGIGSYDGRSAFSTWLTRVTINTCLSWHRTKGRRAATRPVSIENPDIYPDRATELSGADGVQSTGGTGHGPGDSARTPIERALEAINPEHRAVLVLRDVRGLDYDAIGAALDLPLGTVKSRIYRARVALRKAVESLDEPGGSAGTSKESES